ncbi:MAG: SDR family oxidoreductase [Acidimicrobiales bacterium]|nr:SDR family oxidoreductase [Acidimicrobiales bacterium]
MATQSSVQLSRLSRSVRDRVVVVTGAASGMGRAVAHLFADEGAKVGLIDRTAGGIELVADEINSAGHRCAGRVADVNNHEAITKAIEGIRSELGPVDILVNNAGVSIPAPIDSDDYDAAWESTIGTNLEAYTFLIRSCLDDLLRNGDGRIVNIASTEGLGATPYMTPYTASKHGVIGLTRGLAVELGRRGVTVNCVAPGPIRTGMTAAISEADKEAFARRRVPVGRYGSPEEVAHAVLSMCLPSASYVNGTVLVVDGGLTAQNV